MRRPANITAAERQTRLAALRALMQDANMSVILVGATSSLRYFTGMSWSPSERLTAALIHLTGKVDYICPGFEREKVQGIIGIPGDIYTWEEEENPYRLVADRVARGRLGVDDQVALFT